MYSLTDKKTIGYLCKKYDFRLKHGLGQNFLLDENIIFNIADAASRDAEGIIEIGPGFGVLTAALANRVSKVVSVEIDEKLLPVLSETLSGFDNVEIINRDILKLDIKSMIQEKFGSMSVSVAANLPYYITTPIIMKLLENRLPLNNIVVMVQKEVAERICAHEGGKDYGAITLTAQYYCKPCIICNVGRELFTPMPNVDSAVLKLTVLDEPSVKVLDEKLFFTIIKASFAQRRKTLINGLKNGGIADRDTLVNVLGELGMDEKIRGESLSLQDFANLCNKLCELRKTL